jgi:hypothetical protein
VDSAVRALPVVFAPELQADVVPGGVAVPCVVVVVWQSGELEAGSVETPAVCAAAASVAQADG